VIARDEERLLGGALESVRPFSDEIVVVDTGSTDRTVEVARAAGARVVYHDWQDDFAAARNAAHSRARGRWLLWVDADERLVAGEGIRETLENAPSAVGGYVIERHDLVVHADSGRADVFPVGMVRLIRNDPRIRWTGIVHERPGETVIDAGMELGIATRFKLEHLVSALPADALRRKQERYLRLLDRAVDTDPDDAWSLYYRGKTRWHLGSMDTALGDFARVASLSSARPFLRASAHVMRAAIGLETGDSDGALRALEESLAIVPDQSLARAVLGEIRYARGEYEAALEAWSAVRLSLSPAVPGEAAPGDLYMTVEKKSYKRGCAHLALGRLVEAARCFDEGLRANRRDAGCWYGLARVAVQRGDSKSALIMLATCREADPGWHEPRLLEEELRGGVSSRGPISGDEVLTRNHTPGSSRPR